MVDFAPGFNPSISLAVNDAAAQPPASPVDTLGKLVDIRNAANQNVLFQNTQSARYKLGRIMATAPTVEAGLAAAQQDPEIAAFAADQLATGESSESAQLGRQQTTQTMGLQGLNATEGALAATTTQPSLRPAIEAASLGVLGPAAQGSVRQGLSLLDKAVNSGTPEEKSQMQAALSAATGSTPSTVRNIMGEPEPGMSVQNFGPGGAPVPVQTGGPVGQTPTATIVGQGANAPGEAPKAPLTGLTPLQQSIQTSEGATAGQVQSDMQDAAATLPNAFNRLNTTYNTLSGFLAGGGADTMANLAKGLQAVKERVPGMDSLIPGSTIDKIAGGNLGDMQLFKETIIPTMAAVLRASSTKQTANEINSYIATMAEDADPRAILGALNQMRFSLQSQAYQLKGYQDFKQRLAKGDPTVAGQSDQDFLPWFYNNYFDAGTGNAKDASAFPEFESGPVKGVGPGGRAAGQPNEPPTEQPAPSGKRRALTDIFGG